MASGRRGAMPAMPHTTTIYAYACDPLTPSVAAPENNQEKGGGDRDGTVQSNADWKILMGLSIRESSLRPLLFPSLLRNSRNYILL